jgi:hypothetical protein
MHTRTLVLILSALLVSAPAHAERNVRLSLGLGGGFVGLPSQLPPAPVALTGIMTTSFPLRGGLRVAAEIAHAGYVPHFAGASVPEVRFIKLARTGASTAMLGFEWQPPRQANWGPFAHVATGIARVAEGDKRWEDMNSGPFTQPGARRTVSAWSAGLGVRRNPEHSRGPGVFADTRLTWTDEQRDRHVSLLQLFGGLTF